MNKHVRLLSEYLLLINETDRKSRPRLSKDSVDDQIDSILLKYESDCIVGMDEEASGVQESLMREAEDDDEDQEKPKIELGAPEDEKAEEIQSQTADKDKVEPDVEADPLTPKIDLKMFCGKVSRLATNYDALLDMPIAIVNRARNYLKQNYSEALADEFAEIMERDFDIKLKHDDTSEPVEKPMAVGAGATGLGG